MVLVPGVSPGLRKCAAVSNRSACSILIRSLTGPHHSMWCKPEWPWRNDTSERQAYRERKSFSHWYRNPVQFHCASWARQEHALGRHAVKGLPALQRQRSRRHRISQHGLLSAHIWPASRRNKSRDPEGLVSARVVREYSRRMAWKQGRCSSTDTPLLQHARWPDRTRWAGLQREFRCDTEEPSRRYEAKDSLVPLRNKGISEACTRMYLLARHICGSETAYLHMWNM